MPGDDGPDPVGAMAGPVREWFTATFPEGPTPAQRLAWPAIAAEEHLLLISPTGTGKTLAAFLAILDRLFREHASGTLEAGLRCVYVSPLRSLGYDIERNLSEPLEAIRRTLGLARSPVTVGVRTGDTSASQRRKLRDGPPHLLITTPESLSLLLSQPAWHEHWRGRAAPGRRRGPRAGPDQARGRPGGLARTARGARRARPEPARPVGDVPARRAGRAVPGRAVADLPRARGARAPGHLADGPRGRVARPARRGPASRPDLSPAAPAARPGTRREPDDGRLRQHAGPDREDHARPAAVARRRVRGGRRTPLGARRRPAPRGRGGAEGRRPQGGRHQHEPGAGRRHRLGRPDGPGRTAGRRRAVRPAGRAVGPSRGRDVAWAAARRDARRAGRRGRHGPGGARGAGRAARGRSPRRSTSSASS